MKRSKRMQSIMNIAQKKQQNAARALGQKQQILAEQRQRLEELMAYREAYARQFSSQGTQGTDARRMHEYRAFLDKLNLAIVQQRDRISLASNDCHVSQRQWQDTRKHAMTIDKLRDRFHAEEKKQQEMREQRELDEKAMQLGLLRQDNN